MQFSLVDNSLILRRDFRRDHNIFVVLLPEQLNGSFSGMGYGLSSDKQLTVVPDLNHMTK